jgi:hypothetical protein
MKNLAILIGVTDYVDSKLGLPGCVNDIAVMEAVMRATGNFEVHTLKSEDGEIAKNRLSETIQRFSQEGIDQLVFYFTGHGTYVKDDFHFLFRDYNAARLAQTTLASKDLDDMLRSLEPNLAVKIIDACHSGISYVKSGATVQQELGDELKARFRNCHFLFSSEMDQKSYSDRQMSDFTAALAGSIVMAQTAEIRYRHVIDYITDIFSGKSSQTPYFVSQGPRTEVFGTFDEEAKSRIAALLPIEDSDEESTVLKDLNIVAEAESTEAVQESAQRVIYTLADLAKQASLGYVDRDASIAVVQSLKNVLQEYALPLELEEIYTAEIEFYGSHYTVPNAKSIGLWLVRNKSGEYFAEPTYRTEYYDAPSSALTNPLSIYAAQNFPQKQSREVVDGFDTEVRDMPFQTFSLTLRPSLPNLLLYRAWLTYILSRTTIQIFHTYCEYNEVAWGKYEEGKLLGWKQNSFQLAAPDDIEKNPGKVLSDFDIWVLDCVVKRISIKQQS